MPLPVVPTVPLASSTSLLPVAPMPLPIEPTVPLVSSTSSLPVAPMPVPKALPGTVSDPAARLPMLVQAQLADPLLMSSQPPPFQVGPDSAPGGDYAGNRAVQDLTSLVAGNFKDTKYKWYGFVRLDGIYDFRPMASTDSFVTSAIPIPQGRGQNAVLSPRYTRFGFDTETPIKSMDWNLKTRVEMDFFNGNTSGSFGSFPLRLRFAWADFGPFLVGQAASLFMDYDVFPNVLDYQGPGGMVLMRQPVFAVHTDLGENFKATIGIEQPYSDIQWFENGSWIMNPGSGIVTKAGVGRNIQDMPDVTANVRYKGDYGHLQVAGIGRKLTFQPGFGDSAFDTFGYGINVTGTLHPWAILTGSPRSGDDATALSKSRFLAAFAAGRGINRYLQDVNGLGLDATYDPINGFRAIPSIGWFVAYEQWWSKTWASNFTYGEDELQLTDSLPGSTYQRANYISGNLIWLPIQRFGVAIEGLYGIRKNKDGERGENTRLQMAFQYRF